MSACAILILFLILTLLITNGSVLRWFFSSRKSEPVQYDNEAPILRSKFNEYVSRDIRLNRTVNPEYGMPPVQYQYPTGSAVQQQAVAQYPTGPVQPAQQPVQQPVAQYPTAPVQPAQQPVAPVQQPVAPVQQPPVAPTQTQPVVPVEPVGVSATAPMASSCNWSEFIDGEPEQELGKQFDLNSAQSACEKESRCEHVSTMKDAKGSDIYVMGYGALKPSTRGMKTSHCTRTKAPPVQTKTGGRFY